MLTGTDGNFRDRPLIQRPTLWTIVKVGTPMIERYMVFPLSCQFYDEVNVSLCNDRQCPFSRLPFPYWNRHCRHSRIQIQNHSDNGYGGAVVAVLKPSTASGLESLKLALVTVSSYSLPKTGFGFQPYW